jgi:hypothetical protein
MPTYHQKKEQQLQAQKRKRVHIVVVVGVLLALLLVGMGYFAYSQSKEAQNKPKCSEGTCQYDWIYIEKQNSFDTNQISVIVAQLNLYRNRFGCFQKTLKIVPTDFSASETKVNGQSSWEPAISTAGVINLDPQVNLTLLKYIIAHEAGHACRSGIIVPLDKPVVNEFGEIYAVDGFTLLIKESVKGIKKYSVIEEAYVDRNAACIPGYDVNSAVYWPMTQKFLQWFPCNDSIKEQELIEWYRNGDIWSVVKELYSGRINTVTIEDVFSTMDWLAKEMK